MTARSLLERAAAGEHKEGCGCWADEPGFGSRHAEDYPAPSMPNACTALVREALAESTLAVEALRSAVGWMEQAMHGEEEGTKLYVKAYYARRRLLGALAGLEKP